MHKTGPTQGWGRMTQGGTSYSPISRFLLRRHFGSTQFASPVVAILMQHKAVQALKKKRPIG